jgi:hypothetical protein
VDALAACLATPEAVQRIRCVPAAAGSAVLFSHRAFHWGSAGRPGCAAPRVCVSFGAADPSFEAPYLAGGPAGGPSAGGAASKAPAFPPLAARLALAAAQVLCYQDRFAPLPRDALARYKALVDAGGAALAPAYRRKVAAEYVAAAKASAAATAGAPAKAGGKAGKGGKAAAVAAAAAAAAAEDESDEEAGALLDSALDAMLDANAVRAFAVRALQPP